MKSIFLLAVLLLFFAACEEQYKYSNIDYNTLGTPLESFVLPDELDEISGLELYNGKSLIAIDDEDGVIYIVNIENGEIENQIDFGEKGDFEGLAYDGKFMYVITSEGDLYKVNPDQPLNFEKFHWDIEGKEIESLSFYKGKLYSMTKEKSNAQEIVLFSMDPEKLGETEHKEAFRIKLDAIKSFLAKDEDESILKQFAKFISGDNIYNFVRPSGITFIPENDHLLILSHHNRFLMEISSDGNIHEIMSLSYEDFHQPEGIALDNKGFLYISNESRGHLPNILKFKYN